MSNMPNCRFQNTVQDVDACVDHIDDALDGAEQTARLAFIDMCVEVALEYGYLVDREVIRANGL